MGVREQVADLINAAGIPGISATPYCPLAPTIGQAWVMWHGSNPSHAFGAVVLREEWVLEVVLPNATPQQREQAADVWRPQLATAIAPIAELDRAEPAQVLLGDGTSLDVLQIGFHA